MEFQAKWIRTSEDTGGVCPVFRKGWKTEKKVERATLYLTALGVYEAHLNGKRVGNYVLAPGWTAYDKSTRNMTLQIWWERKMNLP